MVAGDLVNTPDLVSALESGQISSAALDVCDPEPIPLDSKLRKMDQVVLAAHIASASLKAAKFLREIQKASAARM